MVVDRVLLFSHVLLTQDAADSIVASIAINDPILALVWNLENWG